MENVYINYRATLFTKKIDISNENLIILLTAFKSYDLLPNINNEIELQVSPTATRQIPSQSLELKKKDNSFLLKFSNERIDIIENKINGDRVLRSLEDFAKDALSLFEIIMEKFPAKSSRMALFASSVCDNMTKPDLENVYKKLFVSNDKETLPAEWVLRKTVQEPFGKLNNCMVNYVSKISRVTAQISYEKTSKERILMEFDYNSDPRFQGAFDIGDINSFFLEVSTKMTAYSNKIVNEI